MDVYIVLGIGIMVFQYLMEKFRKFGEGNGLPDPRIWDVWILILKVIYWLATDGSGVQSLMVIFTQYDVEDGVANPEIHFSLFMLMIMIKFGLELMVEVWVI